MKKERIYSGKKTHSCSLRLKERLYDLDMKQIELADRAGVSRGKVSSYCSGRYEPKQDTLYKLAKVLCCSEMWLAGYDVPKERSSEQKNTDEIVDLARIVTDRIKNEENFKQLIKLVSHLKQSQIDSIITLLQNFQ